jgi:hypothetical protein
MWPKLFHLRHAKEQPSTRTPDPASGSLQLDFGGTHVDDELGACHRAGEI